MLPINFVASDKLWNVSILGVALDFKSLNVLNVSIPLLIKIIVSRTQLSWLLVQNKPQSNGVAPEHLDQQMFPLFV